MKNLLLAVLGIVMCIAIAVGALTFMRNFDRQPSVILASTECNPPCWYGIEPGQNEGQVYSSLEKLVGVNQESIQANYDKNYNLKEIFWFFQRPVEDGSGTIYFSNDRVTAIRILTVNSLKLTELIEKLGEPEKYWTEIGQGEDREYLDVLLFHPTKGYLAEVIIDIESGENQVNIQAASPVFSVTYFAPEMFQELLDTKILTDQPVDLRTGSFQTWSGFGTISFERK